jgi:hypothetical protein
MLDFIIQGSPIPWLGTRNPFAKNVLRIKIAGTRCAIHLQNLTSGSILGGECLWSLRLLAKEKKEHAETNL